MTKRQLEIDYELLSNNYEALSQKLKETEMHLLDYTCEGRYVSKAYHEDKLRAVKDECYQAILRLSKLIR